MDAVPYSAAVKTGLQFKRRFREEDEAIYGGITFTDLPVRQIAYPSMGFNKPGKGVMTKLIAVCLILAPPVARRGFAHRHPERATDISSGSDPA